VWCGDASGGEGGIAGDESRGTAEAQDAF